MIQTQINWTAYRRVLDSNTVSDDAHARIFANIKARAARRKVERKNYHQFTLIAVAACAVLTVTIIGLQIFGNGGFPGLIGIPPTSESGHFSQTTTGKTGETAASSTASEGPTNTPSTSAPPPLINGEYHWNTVAPGPVAMMYKDPDAVAHTVTFEAFCDSLGYDPTPKYIPQGFENKTPKQIPFYINPDGTLADYYSFYEIPFEKGEDLVSIRISRAEVDKHIDSPVNSREYQKSAFNGFEAVLKKTDLSQLPSDILNSPDFDPSFYFDLSAEFQMNEINYYAYTKGNVSADEFIKVIQSLA